MMDMNTLFDQVFRELDEEQNINNAPGSPEKEGPVFSSTPPASGKGFGLAVPVAQENMSDEQKLQSYVDSYNIQNPENPITVNDIPDRSGFWGGAQEVGYGMLNAVRDQFPEDMARIYQGDDVKLDDDSWSQKLIDEQEKDRNSRVLSKQVVLGDGLNKSLYEGPSGIATSAAVGTAGAAAGATAGSVVPGLGTTAGAMVGAAGATGPAFYRLAKNQFLHEVLDTAKKNNVELTESEWEEIKKDIDDEASEMGLWEAGPEAVSQFFTAGLIKGVGGKLISKIPGLSKVTDAISKKALARIPAKLAAEIGEEEATEYATYRGQEGIRKDVGLRETEPSLQEFIDTQAGQVAVGAGLQLGVHKVGDTLLSSKSSEAVPDEKKIVSGGEPVDLLEEDQKLKIDETDRGTEPEPSVADDKSKSPVVALDVDKTALQEEKQEQVLVPENEDVKHVNDVLPVNEEIVQQEVVEPDSEWNALMHEAWDTVEREQEKTGVVQGEGLVSDPAQADPVETLVPPMAQAESPEAVEASGQQDALTASRLDALPSDQEIKLDQPVQKLAQNDISPEQLDRLPASLSGTSVEPVDRSTYDEKSRRTTKQTRLFEEQLRKEYGLDFPDGSVFEVKPGKIRRVGRDVSSTIHQEVGREGDDSSALSSSREGLKTLDRVAGLFGKKIVYVASDLPILPGDAHADLKQGLIFMRPDANAPHLYLLGHEIVHLMKTEYPDLYNRFYDLADNQIEEGTWDKHHKWRDNQERKAGRKKGLTRSHADEEFLADFSGEQFMEPNFWKELAAEEPSLFRKAGEKVKLLIDKMLTVLSLKGKRSRYFHDIQLVRKGLVSAIAEYSSRQNAKPSSRQDGNPIHFSKSSTVRNSSSVRSVRGAVQELQARAENALPLEVVQTFEELPEHIRTAFEAQGGGYCEGCNDPKTGKVWMVAENISSRKRAVELWMHEQGAHHGLRGLLGDSDYVQLLRKVGKSAKRIKEFKNIALGYDYDLSTDSGRDMASHEYLARLAEKVDRKTVLTSREKGVWRKVVDAVMRWLAKLRIRLPGSLTRSEINRIVSNAVFWTVQGDGSKASPSGTEAVSYSSSNPVRESAMAKIGHAKEKSSGTVTERISDRVARIREFMSTELKQGMFDRFASLKDLDKAAGVKDIEESAYVAARMSTSHADQIAAVIEHGAPIWREGAMDVEGEGLAKVFEPVAHELNRFTGWLVGLRAKKLMAEGRENLFTKEEIDELCKLNSGREAQYEAVQKKYIAFKTKVLDFAQDAGVINAAGRTLWEHDEYIPFYRINEEGNEKASVKAPHSNKGIANQRSGIRRLRGGTSNIGDPFENIIRNFSHLIDSSVKNRAMELAMVNAEKIGVATDAEFEWEGLQLKGKALRSSLVKVFGDNDAVARMTPAQSNSLQTVFRMVKPDAKDVVSVLRDGKPVYYHIGDPLLLRALTSVNLKALDFFGMKAARVFKRMLTTGVTSTPDFMIRNIVRDTVHAWGVDRTGTFVPVVGSFKGAIKTLSNDEDTVKMMAAGAAFHGGYAFGHDPAAAKLVVEKLVKKHKIDPDSILDTPKKLAKFAKLGWMKWEALGAAFENATRAKLYEGVKKKGGSHLEAAYEAKDIMDYSMGGDWKVMRFMCETIPFFGARMVGLNRLGRGAYENPSGFMAKGALVALGSVLLYLNNRDRDEFKELEQWDRDNYYHFFVGGKHIRKPKPFEIGAIFGTLPERLTEYVLDGQDGDLLRDRLQFMLTQTFNVGVPQFAAPVLEEWANKSFFTGRAIVPMRLSRLKPGAQRDYRTSETAAVVGEKTGISPKRIEHLVNGYFGTLGVYVMSMADIMTRRMVDAPELPTRRLDELPVISSFYRSKPARNSRHLTELYDMVQEADELYSTVMNYAKTGEADKAKALVKDPENRKILAKRRPYNRLRRALGQIETAMRQIHRSRKLTPDEKRERIDALLEKRNLVVRRGMGD